MRIEWWCWLDWWFYDFGGLGSDDFGAGIDYMQGGVGVLAFVFASRLGCSIKGSADVGAEGNGRVGGLDG